jgi:hypothetical protein
MPSGSGRPSLQRQRQHILPLYGTASIRFQPNRKCWIDRRGIAGRNYGGGWTHVFNPTLILDVRAGYAGRPGVDAGQQNTHPAGLDPVKSTGFKDIDTYNGMLVGNLTAGEWTNGGNNSFGIRGRRRARIRTGVSRQTSWVEGQPQSQGRLLVYRGKANPGEYVPDVYL